MENKIKQTNPKVDSQQEGHIHFDEQSVQNTMRPALTNLDYIYCTGCKFVPMLVTDENAPMTLDKDGKEVKPKLYAIKAQLQFSF